MTKKPNTHGGQREGAGRKPIGDLVSITVKIPRDLKERASKCPNLSQLIRDFLESQFPPKSVPSPASDSSIVALVD